MQVNGAELEGLEVLRGERQTLRMRAVRELYSSCRLAIFAVWKAVVVKEVTQFCNSLLITTVRQKLKHAQ